MVGLTLFQQLHNLARYAFAQTDPGAVRDVDLVGMDYLWKVALRANNTGTEKQIPLLVYYGKSIQKAGK